MLDPAVDRLVPVVVAAKKPALFADAPPGPAAVYHDAGAYLVGVRCRIGGGHLAAVVAAAEYMVGETCRFQIPADDFDDDGVVVAVVAVVAFAAVAAVAALRGVFVREVAFDSRAPHVVVAVVEYEDVVVVSYAVEAAFACTATLEAECLQVLMEHVLDDGDYVIAPAVAVVVAVAGVGAGGIVYWCMMKLLNEQNEQVEDLEHRRAVAAVTAA